MDKRQKLEFFKCTGAKLSFSQNPNSLLLLPPPPPCRRRLVRRGEGAALACRRHARWRRCRCRWAPPSGVAASAGGAVPPGGRPYGGGFARGSSGGKRRCPWAASPASNMPAASRPSADCCRLPAYTQMAVLPSTTAARAAKVVALFRFCVNDFDVKSFFKTQHTQFKTNHSHEQPGSDTTVGKSWGRHHMHSRRTRKQNPRFPKGCSSLCEDWCAKSAKLKNCV